jgi:hypothetical protein
VETNNNNTLIFNPFDSGGAAVIQTDNIAPLSWTIPHGTEWTAACDIAKQKRDLAASASRHREGLGQVFKPTQNQPSPATHNTGLSNRWILQQQNTHDTLGDGGNWRGWIGKPRQDMAWNSLFPLLSRHSFDYLKTFSFRFCVFPVERSFCS